MWIGIFMAFLASVVSVASLATDSLSSTLRQERDDRAITHQFLLFKNHLMSIEERHGPLPHGIVQRSVLESSTIFSIDYEPFTAQVTTSGWTLAWMSPGRRTLHHLQEVSDFSASLCTVAPSGACMSPRFTTPLIQPIDMPTSVPVGSVVYAWRSKQ